ncbi:hypothetical protein OAD81_03280 [Flavobacteriaceae bacterium]|jgi:hypothetical protein|nr:hypothetical protein [Flavobacteriaceae bacterium]MDB4063097.1 hypothetical protein [Flavobacteriaceae bacterium]MDB4255726.1 hypothetical protein [Flavobacteriaceae bacterium]MDC0001256.1 hypothetical protein [Flavobacteriaceae bacterium]
MKKHLISEILYWVIAVISIYEAFVKWNSEPSRAILFIGFAGVSIFMAIFRRHYRKKFDKRSNSSK